MVILSYVTSSTKRENMEYWKTIESEPYILHYCKKITTDESFLLLKKKKKKKKLLRKDKYKWLELKKEICDHNKFDILCEELGNGELSSRLCIWKVHQHYLIPLLRFLSITSSTEISKAMFRMSIKIHCLQKVKHFKI